MQIQSHDLSMQLPLGVILLGININWKSIPNKSGCSYQSQTNGDNPQPVY